MAALTEVLACMVICEGEHDLIKDFVKFLQNFIK